MKILFICSGNKSKGPSNLVVNQGISLIKSGVSIDYFTIQGKGCWGYFKNIKLLKRHLKKHEYDIVHAHYSFSGFVASLAGAKPLIVSLMGSDTYLNGFFRTIARIFYFLSWNCTIVKTEAMKHNLRMKKAQVIPNGVDLKLFKYTDKNEARKKIGYSKDKKLIIFVANPSRAEKNYKLALQSINQLKSYEAELLSVYNVSSEEVATYMSAADVLLLTSKWEGSVNVIKEALASNLPLVSVNVGDVAHNINGVSGCYLTSFNPQEIASKLEEAISFSEKYNRTNGREKIVSLGLDSKSVALRIINLYNTVLATK